MEITNELSDVVQAVQAYQHFVMRDALLKGEVVDWYEETKRYYLGINSELLENAGLTVTEKDYKKVLEINLEDEV